MADTATIVLNHRWDREKVARWAAQLPPGTRVEFSAPNRTLPQNDTMRGILADIAKQGELDGKKFDADEWKAIFMGAVGVKSKILPSLDGENFVPYLRSSKKMKKEKMAEMITMMIAWADERGIVLKQHPLEQHQ